MRILRLKGLIDYVISYHGNRVKMFILTSVRLWSNLILSRLLLWKIDHPPYFLTRQ